MEITKEIIEGWKKKHTDIFAIKIDGKTAYLKKPDRKILGAANTIGQKDPLKFNEMVLNNCWLGGDEEIKTDDGLFLSASAKMSELMELKEAEVVKL